MPSHRLRTVAAVLLTAEALLLMHPVLAVSHYFVGAAVVGKSLAHIGIPDVTAQGIAYLLGPFIVVLLLLAAWGVAHGTRGVGALVLQAAVLPFVALPMLRPAWGALLGVVLLATAGVLVGVVARGAGQPGGHRRWWWLAGFGAGALLIAGLGASTRSLPFDPTAVLTSAGAGTAGARPDLPAPRVPQNPSLAPNPFNSIHNDAWAGDAYDLPAPADPRGGAVESFFAGGDCATITFDSRGRLVTLCSTLTRVIAYVLDPGTLEVIDSRVVGERRPSLTDFSGGGYFVLDARDRIVFPARGGVLRILATTTGLPEVSAVDVSATLQPGEQVTSVLPDWQGRYWYVGALGTVGVVREGRVSAINLDGEDIENSFAVADDGVYVVTGAALYRLDATAAGPPRVQWRTAYDAGVRQKPGQTSRASGTTPTLVGDVVAITDNAEPRMNVVVVQRATGRVRCRAPVFTPGRSATDNSLIALDGRLIVENNYGYRPAVLSTTGGRSTEPGLAAVSSDDCSVRWANDTVRIPSLVSKATSAGGLVLTYTKPPSALGTDAWYFTAVDVRTGAVVWTRRAGTGAPFNNHYAAAYLGPDGDMFVGTLNGLVVLRQADRPSASGTTTSSSTTTSSATLN